LVNPNPYYKGVSQLTTERLTKEQWEIVISNIEESGESIEITWLDGSDEWCLNVDCELLEDGFKSEREAMNRLIEIGGY
jgi:hypothetical protein